MVQRNPSRVEGVTLIPDELNSVLTGEHSSLSLLTRILTISIIQIIIMSNSVQMKHVLNQGQPHSFYGSQLFFGIISILTCTTIGKFDTECLLFLLLHSPRELPLRLPYKQPLFLLSVAGFQALSNSTPFCTLDSIIRRCLHRWSLTHVAIKSFLFFQLRSLSFYFYAMRFFSF